MISRNRQSLRTIWTVALGIFKITADSTTPTINAVGGLFRFRRVSVGLYQNTKGVRKIT